MKWRNINRKHVKILIDTGHLIVSSKTLNINESNQLDLAKNLADAYHLSTNNRLRDQNKEFNNKDKIMQAVNWDADFYTIEVYSEAEGIKKSLDNLISFSNKLKLSLNFYTY